MTPSALRSSRRLVDVIDAASCRVRSLYMPRAFELSGLIGEIANEIRNFRGGIKPPVSEGRNDLRRQPSRQIPPKP